MKYLYHSYNVKQGDSIASIAKENHMDSLELALVNQLFCPRLRVGQRLLIPQREDQGQRAADGESHELAQGKGIDSEYRQYEFSQDYMKKLVKDITLSNFVISPNGDGLQDTVTGSFTLSEKVDYAYVFIVNEVGTHVAQVVVQNQPPALNYTFTWNGKDERGNSLYNGNYYVQVGVSKDMGHGDLILRDKPIKLVGSMDIVVPQPVEKVKFINNTGRIATLPTGMEFSDQYGKVYPILGFEVDQWKGERYLIKVTEGVAGYVKVTDVEMVEYEKLPKMLGKPAIEGVFARTGPAATYPVVEMLEKDESFRVLRKDGSWYRILMNNGKQAYLSVTDAELTSIVHPVASGDVLWKLAQRYGTTIEAIAKANNIDAATPLNIGQQLRIPVSGASGNQYIVVTDSPDLRFIKLSSRTIAYDAMNVPGYLTIDMETTIPTRGYIEVKGNAVSTRINLSTDAFKTEHVINWVPWDDTGKQPLPVGEYQLTLHLTRQDGTNIPAIGLGKINVTESYLKKGFVVGFGVNPDTITPRYDYTEPLTTVTYGVSRHAMGQIVIRDDKGEYFHSPLEFLTPEKTYTIPWDGRGDLGGLMPNGTYSVEFRAIDLDYNYPDTVPKAYQAATIRVYGGDYRIPEARIRQVVQEVKLNGANISPNGDGVNDTISGTVTFSENTRADIWVINSARVNIKQVLPFKEYAAGSHSFTWDGKDFYNSGVLNGTYSLSIMIAEGDNFGSLILDNLKIQVTGAYDLVVPKPEQRVRVTAEKTELIVDPNGQSYIGKRGEVYPIISYSTNYDPRYRVKVGDSASGYVLVQDVEMIDLSTIPEKWGKVITAGTVARSVPSNYHQIVEVLLKDAVVRILRQDDTWYRILLNSGRQAYVKTSELVETAAPGPTPAITYTVVSGDTLWKLAQKFSVTVDAIAKANNISVTTPLMVGQKLMIPSKSSDEVKPRVRLAYIVKPGDVLWKIAQANGVTVNELLAANKLKADDALMIGQQLMIPVIHIVAAGDTLWKIAAGYQTTVQRLTQLSGLDASKPLYIGQRVMISM